MLASTKAPRESARVTMRFLAAMAGVSVQAVSLALRNQPSVGLETRAQIQALARKFGYAPDPQLVKLMHHLRAGSKRRIAPSVCFLTTRPAAAREAFCDLLLEGAIEGARQAGFLHQVVHFDPDRLSGDRLQRRLRASGVEGLLLLPMADLRPLDHMLEWREFSIVSATLSVTSPKFDQVAADHFLNLFSLCSRLHQAGYRRPGLVIESQHDQRCGYLPTASLAWHGVYGNLEPTLAHRCVRLEREPLWHWYLEQRPDVLLVAHDPLALELRELRLLPADLPIISCSVRPLANGNFPFAGNYDNPRQIGAVAAETLARKIAIGQRGIPENPHTTLIRGSWVGELVNRPRRRKAQAQAG